MNKIKLTRLRRDYDGMIQVQVRLSTATHSAAEEVFLYTENLLNFAGQLMAFPDGSEKPSFEAGSLDEKWYGHLLIQVFLISPTGPPALEFRSTIRGDVRARAACVFFALGLPADFNHFGLTLRTWAASNDSEFQFSW